MNFKKWVKSIQTAGYNGVRAVLFNFVAFDSFLAGLGRNQVYGACCLVCPKCFFCMELSLVVIKKGLGTLKGQRLGPFLTKN